MKLKTNLKMYQSEVSQKFSYTDEESSEVLKFPLQEEEVEVMVLINMKEIF